MEYLLATVLLVALVAFVVLRPLLRGVDEEVGDSVTREELEAAKEAKYREIRDAQLDLEMGKLSAEDHRSIDRELRAEAILILQQLDALDGETPGA